MESLLLKEYTYEIIGACYEVHRNLGCGFLEAILNKKGCSFLRHPLLLCEQKEIFINA
ncbi:MAG: GxxExxY protein [Bacteroidota bacterium]